MLKRIGSGLLNAAIGTMRALLVISLCALPLAASQNNLFNSTSTTLSGLTAIQNINNGMDSLNTCNSGSSAPANQLSGTPSAGNCWYNTSTGAVQYYDGTNWLTIGYIDATNHIWTPVIGGNAATTVASATTTALCGASGASPTGAYLTISGTTTITGFGSNCVIGQAKVITFSGVLTLTYNASSMIIPGSANITTAAGDTAVVVYLGSSNWKVALYQPIGGGALNGASLTGTNQTLSGGATVTAFSIGTESSGTYTPNCGNGPLQYLTNGGAFTLAVPANDSSCDILSTNNASAGTLSFSVSYVVGVNVGEALDTVNTHKFIIHIERINGTPTYFVKALQ
jgi:hypothetical protein